MELQILLILAIAFLVLGPEKTIELASKLGEFLRKLRETWEELRYQMYIENLNKKIMQESKDVESKDEFLESLKEESQENERQYTTSHDAPSGPPEGAKKQTD